MFNTISKKIIKLTILSILVSPTVFFLTPEISSAQLLLLEDYGGALDKVEEAINLKQGDADFENRSNIAVSAYIDFIVKYATGLLSIAAVIMLIYAGVIYIGSETFSKKSDAKDIIIRSIGAIVLLLSSFVFFQQLNPELLKVRFAPIKITPDTLENSGLESIWDDVLPTSKVINSYEDSGLFNQEDCGKESYTLKHDTYEKLKTYLSKANSIKQKGRKTVIVDDFTENEVDEIDQLRITEIAIGNSKSGLAIYDDSCDDVWDNFDNYEKERKKDGFLEKFWNDLMGDYKINESASKRNGYINNFNQGVDVDDCVLISKYKEVIEKMYKLTKKAYDSCTATISNNSEITDWVLSERNHNEKKSCEKERKLIENWETKTKLCHQYNNNGVYNFKKIQEK